MQSHVTSSLEKVVRQMSQQLNQTISQESWVDLDDPCIEFLVANQNLLVELDFDLA